MHQISGRFVCAISTTVRSKSLGRNKLTAFNLKNTSVLYVHFSFTQQKLICTSSFFIFLFLQQLIQKLNCFVIRPAAVPIRLHDSEEEEIPEEVETDELMRSLAPKQMVAPRFRWRRSRWLRYCPVALYDGNKVLGKPEFAVR